MLAAAAAAFTPLFVPDYLYDSKHHSGHNENNDHYFNNIHFIPHTSHSTKS